MRPASGVQLPARLCSVCVRASASFTCPRCHTAYCSKACYKAHSVGCTEAFYREQATEVLRATRAEPDDTARMLQILQRLHQQDTAGGSDDSGGSSSGGSSSSECSDDEGDDGSGGICDDGSLDALARLPEVKRMLRKAAKLGDAFEVDEEELTPELQSRLERLALSGALSYLVAPWQPWWTQPEAAEVQLGVAGQPVVELLGSTTTTSSSSSINGSGSRALPAPPAPPLPRLAELAGPRHAPSPLLCWQLLQLLISYCCFMRRCNGQPYEGIGPTGCNNSSGTPPWEAAAELFALSPPLLQAAAAASAARKPQQRPSQPPQPLPMQQQQQLQSLDNQAQSSADGTACSRGELDAAAHSPPSAPDSLRCARMQLLFAAAALAAMGTAAAVQLQLPAAGAPPPRELRTLLDVAAGDALQLLRLGRCAVLLALADVERLMRAGRDAAKASSTRASGSGRAAPPPPKGLAAKLLAAALKVRFVAAWANEQPPAAYELLEVQLGAELQEATVLASAGGVVRAAQAPPVPHRPVHQLREEEADSSPSQPLPVPLHAAGHTASQCAIDAPEAALNSRLYELD